MSTNTIDALSYNDRMKYITLSTNVKEEHTTKYFFLWDGNGL